MIQSLSSNITTTSSNCFDVLLNLIMKLVNSSVGKKSISKNGNLGSILRNIIT